MRFDFLFVPLQKVLNNERKMNNKTLDIRLTFSISSREINYILY